MKIALVAFEGELMCFAHVLLNALDMADRGHAVAVVLKGAATRLIAELAEPGRPFARQYAQVRERGLIAAVCRACAAKMGTLEAAEQQRLPLRGEMSGHPPLVEWLAAGYQVLTF